MQSVAIDRIQRVANPPRFDQWLDARAPVKRGAGYEIQVHCGRHGEVENPRVKFTARTVLAIRVDGGKRVEFEVSAGERAFLVVLSGSGRVEGEETAVKGNDVVWFKVVVDDDRAVLGLAADVELRALFYSERSTDVLR
jgi:redox-sensitive bicupin YhaK (pirin superfamily)